MHATKTINLEAYGLLAELKRPGQSFSDVIKERLRSERTARGLLQALPGIAEPISDETLECCLDVVRSRRKSLLRAKHL